MNRIFLIIFSVFVFGCATEGDKRLNEQNFHAGNFVADKSTDPEIVQAGKDVAANSEVIAVGIGVPKVKSPSYSPEVSAQAREQAKKEHEAESGIFTWVKKNIAAHLPWGAVILGLLGGVVKLSRKLIHNKRKLVAVYSGINNVITEAKNGVDVKNLPTLIVDTLRVTAAAHNVYTDIKSDLHGLIKKGVIKPS